ncbi:MAG: hypothetical protein ACK4QW_11195 [Alphaproteobacteria bacterium]
MACDLLVVVTAHGFGHAAQAGAVVAALRTILPEVRVTVRTDLPRPFLDEAFAGPFDLVRGSADIGMVNRSAFEVDRAASAAAYRDFHRDWPGRLAAEAACLRTLAPRLILADVPYLTLAAAAAEGIPAVALCSLNWADVYAHYLGDRPEAPAIHAEMLAAYRAAAAFLVPKPGMAMPALENVRHIGPLARTGRARRPELAGMAGAGPTERLGMVAFGGLGWAADFASWPRTPGWRWLVQSGTDPDRDDMTTFAATGMPAIDILASVDAVVGKLGYGLPVEAACHGKPMLYVSRSDWPETPVVASWMEAYARAAAIPLESLRAGTFVDGLEALLAAPSLPPVAATGGAEAAALRAGMLDRRSG